MAPGLPEMLLWKSATLVGFFLLHYAPLYKKHLQKLVASWQSGKLHVSTDAQQFRSDLNFLARSVFYISHYLSCSCKTGGNMSSISKSPDIRIFNTGPRFDIQASAGAWKKLLQLKIGCTLGRASASSAFR